LNNLPFVIVYNNFKSVGLMEGPLTPPSRNIIPLASATDGAMKAKTTTK
jgi:hypothetical protein